MGVIREFGGSDRFDIGIFGFYDFLFGFLYKAFLSSRFSWFLLNVYTHMCLYLQWSTIRIYAMSPIPHVILTVLILGFQKGVLGMIL